MHLEEGRTYTYEELLKTAAYRETEEDFPAVCGECSWFAGGYCSRRAMISKAEALLHGKEEQDRQGGSFGLDRKSCICE